MSKFIDADRLRAEIERRIHEISHPLKDGYEVQSIGKIEGLSELLEIIDFLQEEQPATAVGKVFTNTDPKLLTVDSDEWQSVLGQFENGQRVRIIIVKED